MRLIPKLLIGAALLAIGSVAYAQYRGGSDEPAHTVVESDGPIELRDYGEMIVAEVTHIGDRRRAANAGFRRLAAYIFAQDRPGAKIAMTSPVIQNQAQKIAMTSPVLQDSSEGGAWRTRFVMPPEYTLETLPEAADDITLTKVPPRRIAAIRFSGNGNRGDLRQQEVALRKWIDAKELEVVGDTEYAFYDAPMIPPRLRRNEVMIEVAR